MYYESEYKIYRAFDDRDRNWPISYGELPRNVKWRTLGREIQRRYSICKVWSVVSNLYRLSSDGTVTGWNGSFDESDYEALQFDDQESMRLFFEEAAKICARYQMNGDEFVARAVKGLPVIPKKHPEKNRGRYIARVQLTFHPIFDSKIGRQAIKFYYQKVKRRLIDGVEVRWKGRSRKLYDLFLRKFKLSPHTVEKSTDESVWVQTKLT